jgi:alkylation response protein AidB-like acyl-CoA dehydrogenase
MMSFELNAQQKMFQKTVREFLKKELPSDIMREILASKAGYSVKMWKKMARLGWTGMLFPETYAGSEYGYVELVILMEQLGYYLYTGPYFATVVLGAMPILNHGSEEQKQKLLPLIAEGKKCMTLALSEPGSKCCRPSNVRMSAKKAGNNWILNGTKLFVSDAHVADYILCAARTSDPTVSDGGVTLFMVNAGKKGLGLTPMENISGRKQSQVQFTNVSVAASQVIGAPDSGWHVVEDAMRVAALARSAEMVGGAQAALDYAVRHAKSRIQFGRAIGSFQAIHHHICNMWISVVNARLLCQKAAVQMDNGSNGAKETAMAKIKAGEALRFVSAKAHQIFGALGFSEEYDMHFYFRRAITDDLAYGDRNSQREVITKALGI